jgi:hypothetical protein
MAGIPFPIKIVRVQTRKTLKLCKTILSFVLPQILMTQIRDLFKNRKIKAKLHAQHCSLGMGTWALKDTHNKQVLRRFHHDCVRSIYGITRWHHQHKGLKLETVLNDLGLDNIVCVKNTLAS